MTIISSSSAPVFELPGLRFTGLASPRRGARETCTWRIRMDGDTPPTFHRVTREEIFVALSGTARVHLNGATYDLAAGDAAIIPPDTDFALANAGDEPFEAVVIFPVGGQAVVPGEAPFTPPWAE